MPRRTQNADTRPRHFEPLDAELRGFKRLRSTAHRFPGGPPPPLRALGRPDDERRRFPGHPDLPAPSRPRWEALRDAAVRRGVPVRQVATVVMQERARVDALERRRAGAVARAKPVKPAERVAQEALPALDWKDQLRAFAETLAEEAA